jgi:hypothetical protein
MKNKKFIIEDWAGNHLFKNKSFKTFEDGWEFIYKNVDNSKYDKSGNENDNEFQEYYVISK